MSILGEYLSGRSWTGLEQALGETPVEKAKQGQMGIAMGYQDEPPTWGTFQQYDRLTSRCYIGAAFVQILVATKEVKAETEWYIVQVYLSSQIWQMHRNSDYVKAIDLAEWELLNNDMKQK